jgi:N-acetyl-gamma-glutamylphosphate reductase
VTAAEAAALITAIAGAAAFGANELRKSLTGWREARAKAARESERERAELEALHPNATRAWQEIYSTIRAEREAMRLERDALRAAAEEIRRACQSEILQLKEEHGRERDSWAAERARWVDERAELYERLDEQITLVQTLRYGPQALDPPGGHQ